MSGHVILIQWVEFINKLGRLNLIKFKNLVKAFKMYSIGLMTSGCQELLIYFS